MKPVDILRSGDLNQRVTLSDPVWNDSGDEIVNHTATLENVPASKRALSGKELISSGRDVSEQWAEFRIRYQPGLESSKRLTHQGTEYDIESIDDPTGMRFVLVIVAKVVR